METDDQLHCVYHISMSNHTHPASCHCFAIVCPRRKACRAVQRSQSSTTTSPIPCWTIEIRGSSVAVVGTPHIWRDRRPTEILPDTRGSSTTTTTTTGFRPFLDLIWVRLLFWDPDCGEISTLQTGCWDTGRVKKTKSLRRTTLQLTTPRRAATDAAPAATDTGVVQVSTTTPLRRRAISNPAECRRGTTSRSASVQTPCWQAVKDPSQAASLQMRLRPLSEKAAVRKRQRRSRVACQWWNGWGTGVDDPVMPWRLNWNSVRVSRPFFERTATALAKITSAIDTLNRFQHRPCSASRQS